MKPLTANMKRAILNLQQGKPIADHLPPGRSHQGGFSGTRWALVQRGLIEPGTDKLTEAGRNLQVKP